MKRFLVAAFVLSSILPVASANEFTLGLVPNDTIMLASDQYYRMECINYYLKDSSGNRLQSQAGNYGTADVYGKYYAYELPQFATAGLTVPIPVGGYDHLTVQNFISHAVTDLATACSVKLATTQAWGGHQLDIANYGVYQFVGSASMNLHVLGSAFFHPDHFLANTVYSGTISQGTDQWYWQYSPEHNEVDYAYGSTPYIGSSTWFPQFMQPIPDMTWEGSRYSNRYVINDTSPELTMTQDEADWLYSGQNTIEGGLIEPATYPITRLGIHHFGVRGLSWASLKFTSNTATQCVIIRLNRDIISNTVDRGVSYP